MSVIKILIADDHQLVADSLRILLETISDFEVVGIVNDGLQAIRFLENHEVDVLLADLHMPLLNGTGLALRVHRHYPKTKVIMLTMSEEAVHIREALQTGIYGYVMKSAGRTELLRAIRTVAAGEHYFSEKVVKKLAEFPNEANPAGKTMPNDIHPLTKREMDVLKLIVQDLSNQSIAEQLNLSLTTVETHRRNLLKKVGVSSAVGLLRWALKHKLVDEL
ncbi:response regulator [Runella sp.]|uniref:response regulator n=1 Tax=Runella sp. TaxID=1960881 RepID=UPI003D0962EB